MPGTLPLSYRLFHIWSFLSKIQLPAPLFYKYDLSEWWSPNTNSRYQRNIPWFQSYGRFPMYPVLGDSLSIEYKPITDREFSALWISSNECSITRLRINQTFWSGFTFIGTVWISQKKSCGWISEIVISKHYWSREWMEYLQAQLFLL